MPLVRALFRTVARCRAGLARHAARLVLGAYPEYLRPRQGDVIVLRVPPRELEGHGEALRLLARRVRDGVHRQTGRRLQVLVLAHDCTIQSLNAEHMERLGWVRAAGYVPPSPAPWEESDGV